MTPNYFQPFLFHGALAALCVFCASLARGQSVEIRQLETPYNHLSEAGKPLSNDEPGSDGRLRSPSEQGDSGLTDEAPTTGQFQGFVSFGGVVETVGAGGYTSYAEYASDVLPRGGPSGQRIHIARAQVGAPYISRQAELLFGSIVALPDTDVNEDPLGGLPEEYWQREPYWEEIVNGEHVGAPYYWSRHARAVFANRPGPIVIKWRRTASIPADEVNDYEGEVVEIDGRVYPLLRRTYLVSSSPAKTPRRMYWTEDSFAAYGLPVQVPTGLTINFIYSDMFPKEVEEAYADPGSSTPVPPGDGQIHTELRTIYHDTTHKSIRAFNWQGRIFLELLGEELDGDRRQHLGSEIIDVVRRVTPADIRVELGEKLTAWPDGTPGDSHLIPNPLADSGQSEFAYQHFQEGERVQFFASRETRNINDFLLHWTEEGLEGLRWPSRYTRYQMVWPDDISKYSHYMRPLVATDEEARETAVEMPTQNVPIIAYQDPLDQPRAGLTDNFAFYTFLNEEYPAHRTLLRFMSGEHVHFERVFSWLADDLSHDGEGDLRAENNLAKMLGEPATGGDGEAPPKMLAAWNPETGTFDLDGQDQLTAPRVENRTVEVGQRIDAPGDESPPKPGEPYWSGHLRQATGNSFNPNAYVDPFVSGFEAANAGAIIPVNAIPGDNQLEVWWFRSNNPRLNQGFQRIYWPSVVGRYTIEWPSNPHEIVLASDHGSGTLENSLEAAGRIYVQNKPDKAGYNPNEEHALMRGDTVYALRDDLNITEGPDYSSEPYVLLEYTGSDGRPAMSTFHVLREKPEAGWVFDYVVDAGTLVDAPMPLRVLPAPVEGIGAAAVNYNQETSAEGGDLPENWNAEEHGEGPLAHYPRFTFRDRKDSFWVYRGPHDGNPELKAGTYDAEAGEFLTPVPATVLIDEPFTYFLHASHPLMDLRLEAAEETPLPDWLSIDGIALTGTPPESADGAHEFTLLLSSLIGNSSVSLVWSIEVVESGDSVVQSEFHLEPDPTNSFTMRFYYKTQEGFAWPGINEPPSVGSIVPYLRPVSEGEFVGDPTDKETTSLDIVYRPVWPASTPGMDLGDTLMTPKDGLPAIRGQSSVSLLYQESIASDMAVGNVSVILHDPTREKEASLEVMSGLPGGVRRELYQGRYYFPNLPPHLVERFFMDPFRSDVGHLVFKGELKEEILGPDWLMLNVLRGDDLDTVKALCPDGDQDKENWDKAIDALMAVVETFHENPDVPGDYIPNSELTVGVGIGDVVEIGDHNTAVDSYALSASGPGTGYVTIMTGGGAAFTPEDEPVSLHIIRIEPKQFPGDLNVVESTNPLSEQLTMQHSADLGGRFDEYEYEWRIAAPVDGFPPSTDDLMQWDVMGEADGAAGPRFTLGGANVRTLSDNYLMMRYRPTNKAHPLYVDVEELTDADWSPWTSPMLAEGWIKRVLAGINPFQQRITDLFNNPISTDVSMLTQAGARWEGDVALNLENINDYGLIEIYETVLRRGRMLSIEAGINYGPANDALLLAAGYLNDLYMFVANEAWADAANPTIGIGTADQTYGDIATSLFAFQGQVPTLLEEELALLRGRDDIMLPGVGVSPVYNRLIWNYTRGIDAGEVIYAINYNIQENPDDEPTGTIDAADAARMFPQGHGDAYGHSLTALKGYYSLLMNPNFDWVPRIEAVLVLGQPVSVDYFDERKFAAAAAAVARAGQHTFDLTWRRDYQSGDDNGWEHFADTRENSQTGRTRYWGMDHWATRTGQGAYINWIVGNAMLPDVDPNPNHEGIQKIDRTTVPELRELTVVMDSLQTNLNNAEAGLTPLGLPEDGIAFDINPLEVTGTDAQTHFEQIYDRALVALNNAVVSFDDAKDVTRLMRSEEDSLAELQSQVAQQEHAYQNALIELYGTPYPDDIGPGSTYATDYDGPDLLHYMYVDLPGLPGGSGFDQTTESKKYVLDIQGLPNDWRTRLYTDFSFITLQDLESEDNYILDDDYVEYELGPHGFFEKPEEWTSRRRSPGQIQQAISERIAAHNALAQALAGAGSAQRSMEKKIAVFNARVETDDAVEAIQRELMISKDVVDAVNLANNIAQQVITAGANAKKKAADAVKDGLPKNFIAGMAAGGDVAASGRLALALAGLVTESAIDYQKIVIDAGLKTMTLAQAKTEKWVKFEDIDNTLKNDQQLRQQVAALGSDISGLRGRLRTINQRLRALDDAERNYRTLVAQGDSLLEEREIFRRRSASIIHGYRTRDAAFRIFRNEKLERYKTLFDLAARYTYLAAQAYDYETGLLHTPEGRDFIDRIVAARALGVVSDGEPQFAGSATGDPGLSSILAEMKGDWSVLRGRLGFNNPDSYGTTVSLRRENYRILHGEAGTDNWRDMLQDSWRANIMDDADVRRHAMQAGADGFAVPGLVIDFSTTIASGRNLFGHPLAAGDHAFSPTSFATKIFAAGVALEGYIGMSDPSANSSSTGFADGDSPDDPDAYWLDPNALAATPYIYLIPVGVDSMRSPPLGDVSTIRSWQVNDVTVPLPFNVGASQFSTLQWWQSGDFLTEEMFSVRKHQAFRPVSSADVFSYDIYGSDGSLQPSQFTNNRLIGRSVWNSEWKLVIPGDTLLNDPDEGLRRLIQTVNDIKLHFITYSYSGN